MVKNWSNTLLVAYCHLPKIIKNIDLGVERRVNSGFKSVHLMHGITNEQLYGEILELIGEKRKMVNLYVAVNTAFEGLDNSCALLIEMRYFKKMILQEISDKFNVPLRTLYRRLDDARVRFQKQLDFVGFDVEYIEKEYGNNRFISLIHDNIDNEKFSPTYKL
jgi:hypothetical protein